MKKIASLSVLLFLAVSAFSQILTPVKWDYSTEHISGDEFNLIFTAKIDDGWTVYSQNIEGDDGPVPTSFEFTKGGHYSTIGKTQESTATRKTVFDEVFKMELSKFYKKAVFTQKVKVSDYSKPITGAFEFMTCDATRCLPPDYIEFSFQVEKPAGTAQAEPATTAPKSEKPKAAKEDKVVEKATSNQSEKTAPAEEQPEETFPSAEKADKPSGILEPVTWDLEVNKLNENEYDFIFKAKVDDGWYLYSQNIPEDGPIPTAIVFDEKSKVEAADKADEVSDYKVEGHDEMFDMNIIKYKKAVTFHQKVKVDDPTQPVTGFVEYMTCDDGRCINPPEFAFKVTPASNTILIGEAAGRIEEAGVDPGLPTIGTGTTVFNDSQMAECGTAVREVKGKGIWNIFILGFLGGLVALLTRVCSR